jgi:hypothetical protein
VSPATLAQLHAPTDLVAVAWIRSIPGLVADGVSTQLPADETSWSQNGFVVVPTTVGGSPHSTIPVHRPVVGVECWGTVPGSDRLPWGIPNQLALQIMAGCWDRTTFGRPLSITAGTVTYPQAHVLGAQVLTEPRRVWSDAGDFAGYIFDLQLHYVSAGERVT